MPHLRACRLNTRRFVALSSTTSRRNPVSSTDGRSAIASGAGASHTRAGKLK